MSKTLAAIIAITLALIIPLGFAFAVKHEVFWAMSLTAFFLGYCISYTFRNHVK